MQILWDQPELALQYGKNAQQRFEALFTAQVMAQKYVALYQTLLKA